MATKLNKAAYEGLIARNLEWLRENTKDTLERRHIELILRWSIKQEYGPRHEACHAVGKQHKWVRPYDPADRAMESIVWCWECGVHRIEVERDFFPEDKQPTSTDRDLRMLAPIVERAMHLYDHRGFPNVYEFVAATVLAALSGNPHVGQEPV